MKKIKFCFLFLFLVISAYGQNNCLDFDGTDDHVQLSGLGISTASGDKTTVEFWMYWDGGQPEMPFGWIGYDLYLDNNNFGFNTGNSGDILGVNSTEFANKWIHIAAIFVNNSTASSTLYINGIEQTLTQVGTPVSKTVSATAGIGTWGYFDSHYFGGKIDEVRIWNTARTEAEIRANMYEELIGNETELIAYYNCNATSGNTLTDNSSNSYTGTLTNMDNTDWQTSSAFFGPKNCLSFDGDNDWIEIPETTVLDFTQYSISVWVMTDENETATILEKETWNSGWNIRQDKWNGWKVGLVDVDGVKYDIDWGGGVPTFGQWYYVGLIFNGSTLMLGVDGELRASTAVTGTLQLNNEPISIGSDKGVGKFFNGKIDEVRIYDTPLTPSQMRENLCKSMTGNESGLVAYYNFDNITGTVLQDFSGNENNGTLTNMTSSGVDNDWVSSSAFNTWLNPDDSSWSNASNWSKDSIPSSTDNVGIFNYTGGTAPALSGNPTLNNLVLGSGSSMTLSSDLTVNGNLILESNQNLSGQTITLGISANLIESGGNLYGTSGTIQTTRTFGAGDLSSGENVAGLGAEITTTSNLGSTTITRSHSAASSPASIQRRFNILPTNNSGLNATLVFNYLDTELNGVTEADMKLFKSDDGIDWTVQSSSSINATNNTITLSGIDSFSWWTAGDGDASLPVNLSSFEALYSSGNPTLYWTTQSESDNMGFNVYRSISQNLGQAIQLNVNELIEGAGSTTEPTDYTFVDMHDVVDNFTYYYWIESVNYDGETEIYGHVSLFIPSEGNSQEIPASPRDYGLKQNYPNPFNPSTLINFALRQESKVKLIIYNIKGEKIKTIFESNVPADIVQYAVWDGTDRTGKQVSSGVYLYKLITDNKVYSKKMIMVQ